MPDHPPILTVTLNTAIDRVLEVENFHIGGHLPATEVSRFPAGKGINLSRGLARLGRESIATGFVGHHEADHFEHVLKTHPASGQGTPGRAVCQLLTARGPTRENITILDPIHHTDTHVRTAGYELTRQDVQRIISKLGLLSREGTLVVFSGSLPPGMTVADLDTLIYMTIGGGARVVLDLSGKLLAQCSSVDLSVVGESEPASASSGASEPGSKKMIWMVKPNRHELAEALGLEQLTGERHLIEAGRRLTRRVSWVVITLGAKGALLLGQQGVWRGWCDVQPEEIASTVGCGDCLLAGVLDAQAAGESPEAVLRAGIAAATANAMRSGVAEFDAELVRRMAALTHVEPVVLDADQATGG